MLCFSQLADVTGFQEPGEVVAQTGPPVSQCDVSMRGEVAVMTDVVVGGSHNKHPAIGRDDKLVFAFVVLSPELVGGYEELSAITEKGLVLGIRELSWSCKVSVPLLY